MTMGPIRGEVKLVRGYSIADWHSFNLFHYEKPNFQCSSEGMACFQHISKVLESITFYIMRYPNKQSHNYLDVF
jgi:hypothetical protein